MTPEAAALSDVIRCLEDAFYRTLPAPDETEFFGYRIFDSARFLDKLIELEAFAPGRRFLEVGCGFGTKIVLAHHMGWDATGIELRPEYIEVGRRIFPPQTKLVCADALRWAGYGDFDLIYLYRPASDSAIEAELEARVIEGMSPNAVLWIEGNDVIERPGMRAVMPVRVYRK